MKKPYTFFLFVAFCIAISFKNKTTVPVSIDTIAKGQVPAITKDKGNNLHLVFGKGDSILYSFSKNAGTSFASPVLVGTLPKLFSFAMRGPQVAITGNTITIIATDQQGNIYSFLKEGKGEWKKWARINDADTVAKEGFSVIAGDGNQYLYAVWLDTREGGNNNIYEAKSLDGGKTWSKNKRIYASPDGHTCECCKPSVAVQGSKVSVMFRNWVNGKRDLYLIESNDAGETFGAAQKLGSGSWTLKGCPMDGGGLTITEKGDVQTVWQRKGVIYACEKGREEKEIGQGRYCTLVSTKTGMVYSWVEEGNVVCLLPEGQKKVLGEGSIPLVKIVKDQLLCIWQQKDHIQRALLDL